MEYPGLLNWANSVRQTMANDPGRQLFKDQVQIHGFSFLDDYLDSIISGQKQDPLIELVKTPGRKRAVSKKPNHNHYNSLEGKSDSTSSTDTFHSVTLGSPSDRIRQIEPFSQTSEILRIENHNQVPTAPASPLLNDRDHIRQTESFPQTSEVLPIEYHNQVPTTPPSQLLNDRDHFRQIESLPQTSEALPIESHNQVPTVPASPLLNDRDRIRQPESFPQTSEILPIENHNQVPTTPLLQLLKDRDHFRQIESFPKPSEVLPIENHNQAPTTPASKLLNDRDHIRQIESFPPTSEILPIENRNQVFTAPTLQLLNDRDHVLTDIQEEDVEISVKLIDKPNPPSFPTLPEPMPLRKSTKPLRDPSMNAVLLGAATPGALVGGKRTSWLMKAREAKALDGLSKKSHPPGTGSNDVGASSSLTFQGTKRKSDPFSLPQVGIRDDERPPKLAKTSEGEMESQSHSPMIVESAQEGVFDRLKKVVEDLGIRVGQTVGMNVGSDTATVLAEARAAAKAKVAERDRMEEEEFTMAVPAPKAKVAERDRMEEEELTMAVPAPKAEVAERDRMEEEGFTMAVPAPKAKVAERDRMEEEITMALPAPETVEHKTVIRQPHSPPQAPLQDEEASKLLSSTKSKQPDVMKVLQMAAVAAKKQQEEADKKAARLKEMESRRQLAIQRKADEERAKALEAERKMKEEAERRKKEREELTDKRSIKYAVKKKEDETLKKRKIEMEKKQEIKKPSSSILIGKAHLKSVLKPSSSATNPSSHAYGSSSQPDPSMLVQSQMAARVKVKIDAPKKSVAHAVPSEDIELPEINSEYSDSEDEDRVRTFNPPEWAQSPELRQALEMQSTLNPDDIFGAVRPLKMEEIFKSRTSRFRARTSSANWTGADRLTMQEQGEYARRMGFK